MKIITENAVYVQKYDIANLIHTDLPIPNSIYRKIFKNRIASNRYAFEKFENPREIEYFSGLDWIVDYHLVKDLSDDEIIEMGQNIAHSRNQIAQQFNKMSEKERKKNLNLITQCELLEFKLYSLRDILYFRQNHLKITLPEGIDYPEGYVPKEENGIQKLIKKIFPNKIK